MSIHKHHPGTSTGFCLPTLFLALDCQLPPLSTHEYPPVNSFHPSHPHSGSQHLSASKGKAPFTLATHTQPYKVSNAGASNQPPLTLHLHTLPGFKPQISSGFCQQGISGQTSTSFHLLATTHFVTTQATFPHLAYESIWLPASICSHLPAYTRLVS